MKRVLLSAGLAATLTIFPFVAYSSAQVQDYDATHSDVQVSEKVVELPLKITDKPRFDIPQEVKEKAEKILANKRKNFTKKELAELKKLPSGTSVSSDGTIVTPQQQQEFIKKHNLPELTGNIQAAEEELTFSVDATSDNRDQIKDTTVYPYKAVAYIDISRHDGGFHSCTGFFIDDDTIATAAHCVYDTKVNKWHHLAYIYPGKNGILNNPYGVHVSGEFQITTGWINVVPSEDDKYRAIDSSHDYAVIFVSDGSASQWFGLRNSHSVGTAVNATGYPRDKPAYTMWRSLGNITHLYTTFFHYNTWNYYGVSGGPVFNSANGSMGALGLNSMGIYGDCYSPRFSGSTYDTLKYWAGLH